MCEILKKFENGEGTDSFYSVFAHAKNCKDCQEWLDEEIYRLEREGFDEELSQELELNIMGLSQITDSKNIENVGEYAPIRFINAKDSKITDCKFTKHAAGVQGHIAPVPFPNQFAEQGQLVVQERTDDYLIFFEFLTIEDKERILIEFFIKDTVVFSLRGNEPDLLINKDSFKKLTLIRISRT